PINTMPSVSVTSHFSTSLSIFHSSSSSTFRLYQIPCHPTKQSKPKHHRLCKVSCHNIPNEEGKPSHNSAEKNRRDILIGLGGLYGASTLAVNPLAIAAPAAPDFTSCGPPEIPKDVPTTVCCPPQYSSPIDFELPARTSLRVRPAAQFVDDAYIAKYKKALGIMRSLPPEDPRSFTQQANIHCAYCNGAYTQVGFPDLKLQVHNSWLFFPFHRWYLYFYERILGSLIDDPDFAIPYWNWDNPKGGMVIPSIFTDINSPLYDPLRNVDHQPPTLIDLDYSKKDDDDPNGTPPPNELIANNLTIVYKSVVSGGKLPRLFLGSPYSAGSAPDPGAGSVENVPHTPVHLWSGDKRQPHRENLGIFYAAGRDPLFYAHHGNVDRMWNIWKTIPGGKRRDFTKPDWLEASFLFYDENKNLVRVKVKDSVDSKKMGYVYQDVDIPWLKNKPKRRRSKGKKVALADSFGVGAARAAEATSVKFPLTLDSKVSILVKRPKLLRSQKEKEEEEEVLVIDGIEFDREKGVKFDVFINDEDEKEIKPSNTEFAGSFVSLPHIHEHSDSKIKTCLKLGITDLLEDLEAEDDESVVVTLVPKYGEGLITIQNIKIEFISE
ncbi:polyphenol oxidase, chloroplastic-like, partial [Vigna radiata var. radiata]|uniref:Polyphenol oxidase, chloroplastic-like n=1 Tax=Vigna radiata var. radiata TaxID=3916 RepID=A0A1S3UVG6_VIGRR